jgi:hypothetical protein
MTLDSFGFVAQWATRSPSSTELAERKGFRRFVVRTVRLTRSMGRASAEATNNHSIL